jgi:hypothetical protein
MEMIVEIDGILDRCQERYNSKMKANHVDVPADIHVVISVSVVVHAIAQDHVVTPED